MYEPGEQGTHLPLLDTNPALQVHDTVSVMDAEGHEPTGVEKEPQVEQSTHSLGPGKFLYVPSEQGVQDAPVYP